MAGDTVGAGPDGALASRVDPAGRTSGGSNDDNWQSTLDTAVADLGIDPDATFEDTGASPAASHDPQDTTPQPRAGSSDGSPSAPPPPTGDAGATPTSASPTPAAEGAPVPEALPFTVTVDGEARPIAGAFRIPGEGLYVADAQVAAFEQMASAAVRADTLEQQNRDLATTTQAFERASRWQTGTNANGQPQYVSGLSGLEARDALLARSLATLQKFATIFDKPEEFAALVDVRQNQDGTYAIVPNAQMLRTLKAEATADALNASNQVRQRYVTLAQPPAPPPPTVADFAKPTIDAIVEQHKIDGLGPDDRALIEANFHRFVTRNPDGSPNGYEPALVDLVKYHAARRAEQTAATTAAAKAGQFNGGMQTGRQTNPQRPAPPKPPTQPTQPAKGSKQQAWSDVLDSALGEVLETMGSR